VTRAPPAAHPVIEPNVVHTEGGAVGSSNFFWCAEQTPQKRHLHEAARHGGALLAVDVSEESRLNAVWAALNGAGAVEVAERSAQCESSLHSTERTPTSRPS